MAERPLPLAAAAQRLRGRPGRPRKVAPTGSLPTTVGPITDGTAVVSGSNRAAAAGAHDPSARIAPRLLDLQATADYLDLSAWTVRDLEATGVLPRVRVPLPGGGELRKVLFDKVDLDRLIDLWKDADR